MLVQDGSMAFTKTKIDWLVLVNQGSLAGNCYLMETSATNAGEQAMLKLNLLFLSMS